MNEKLIKWYARNGFTPDGYTYLIINGNTYRIKDALKERGARYNPYLGWHINYKLTDLPSPFACYKINFTDVYTWDDFSNSATELEDGKNFINSISAKYKKEQELKSVGSYYGTIGERYKKVKVTLLDVKDCSQEGFLQFLYKFKTTEGQILCWFTSAYFFYDFQPGDTYYLNFGVKNQEVSKYNEKITYLTRVYIYDAEEKRIK